MAVYHIWIGRVSGGVDVFFAISGFLLIGALGRRLMAGQPIQLLPFISRLAQRLLAPSYLTLAFLIITGWIWIPTLHWEVTYKHIAASALYAENWMLAFSSIDYLDRTSVGLPTQHFWAMSAQVQALILIAVILKLTGTISRLLRRRLGPVSVGLVLGTLCLTSLGYSVAATHWNQPFAYYNTFARIWQFAAGGLVGLLLQSVALRRWQRIMGGWLGLVALLACGIVLEVSQLFPGYAALWPVGASALILVCGAGIPIRFSASALLASRPLQFLGELSYPLYLWHWPLLAMYLTVSQRTKASLAGGLLLLATSILLAWLTTRLVEAPIRAQRSPNVWRPLQVSACGLALLAVGVIAWHGGRKTLERDEMRRSIDGVVYVGARAIDAEGFDAGTAPVHPGPLTVSRDPGTRRRGCIQSMTGTEVISCVFGPDEARHSLVLVGGSHSEQWVPAIIGAMEGLENWHLRTYTKSACAFSTEPLGVVAAIRESCESWNRRVLERLLTEPPTAVLLLGTRTSRATDGGEEHVPQGYRDQWLPLLDRAIPVIAIRDTPRFGFDVAECVALRGRSDPRCALPREQVLGPENPFLQIAEASRMHLIDLTEHICFDTLCPPVIGNVLVYKDLGHLSAAYMETLGSPLGKHIHRILESIASTG